MENLHPILQIINEEQIRKMVARQIVERIFKWTRFRNLEKVKRIKRSSVDLLLQRQPQSRKWTI